MFIKSELEITEHERELLRELGFKEAAQHQAVAILAECDKMSVQQFLKGMLEHQILYNRLDDERVLDMYESQLSSLWEQEVGGNESVDNILDLLDIRGNKAKVIATLAKLDGESIKSYVTSILNYQLKYLVTEVSGPMQHYLENIFCPLLKTPA